ncbi:hypothetical protein ACIHDR_47400, partial [Nocardia sp. NPDC052278]
LEDACIKLSVVASDIFGVSGRAMMAALIGGEPEEYTAAATNALCRHLGVVQSMGRVASALDNSRADRSTPP